MEALKYRYNQGKRSNLFFFRDSNGNEVDLISEQGRSLAAIEIKAGATINADYFKGLRQFKKTIGDSHAIVSGVIYGGEELQRRSDSVAYGALNCHELFGELLDSKSTKVE
jgi:predicted AAA+ superfamily ATPase